MRARTTIFAIALALVLAAPGAHVVHGQRAPIAALDTVTRLGQIDAEVAQALGEVEQAEADGARIQAELAGMGAAREAGTRRLTERTRALYRLTRAGVLPFAGGFDALLGHAARVERLERMLERDVSEMRELTRRESALREETEAATTRIASARARVTALEAEKARLVETSSQLSGFDVAMSGAVDIPAGGGSSSGEGFGIRFSDTGESATTSAFESRRGELALPVAAPTAFRDATRDEGSGVELVGTRGATVRAAAAGRIAYADRHPGYGSLVIIDHGNNYFTVYGGLGAIDTQVGDEMPRAGRVGSVGTTPIFFQVRRGTRALDAHAWLGI